MITGISMDKTGIFLSKPISIFLVLIYLLQTGLVIILIKDKYDLHQVIDYQRGRIHEMEEKLKILEAVEDFQTGFSDHEKRDLANAIFQESDRYGYDPFLILAVILAESSLKKGQVSENGAVGVMQIKPSTGRDMAAKSGVDWQGPDQLLDPALNVRLGTLYLFHQLVRFKDLKQAIIAYNLGGDRLRGRLAEKGPLPRQFLHRILDNYTMLKEKYDI
jgi:soluble lytic murein transglycosylase